MTASPAASVSPDKLLWERDFKADQFQTYATSEAATRDS